MRVATLVVDLDTMHETIEHSIQVVLTQKGIVVPPAVVREMARNSAGTLVMVFGVDEP